MYANLSNEDILNVKQRLDSVSSCFCMAKWMHCTLHLMNGTNHSCYLPAPHPIPLDELKRSPSALHNTNHKKEQRRKMLKGERPEECGMCWSIEDLGSDLLSDRILRGGESWTAPYLDKVSKLPWDHDVFPTYLEVSFSATCNFKCSYCSPHVSTKWLQEVREQGAYKLSNSEFQNLKWMSSMMPIEDEEQNPFVKAFWQWWPELCQNLQVFRITGGEPLLSPSTWRIIDWIDQHPNPNLKLDINSNFGVGSSLIEKFTTSVKKLLSENKIKSFELHTSLDSSGAQAEYIRHGLKFDEYQRNIEGFLERVPLADVAFMCTYNALSVVGFRGLIDWVVSLRERFQISGRKINLDIPHLTGPAHQSIRILSDDYQDIIRADIEYMKQKVLSPSNPSGVRRMEIAKLERILSWMSQPTEQKTERLQADFYLYFSEHDRRRKTNFLETFPEMVSFWRHCQKKAESFR